MQTKKSQQQTSSQPPVIKLNDLEMEEVTGGLGFKSVKVPEYKPKLAG